MISINEILITRQATLKEALSTLERTGSGILLLVKEGDIFERTITDGDLRRMILAGHPLNETLEILPNLDSTVIKKEHSRREVLSVMNAAMINHLPVIDNVGKVIDLLERKEIDQQILLSTPHMGSAEREYVDEAFETNWIAPLGPNVDAFEKELAQKVGIKHAAALISGTAAIHLGLRLLGVNQGDKVFCSTLTFAASANPIIYQGAEPVFIDSDRETWNMSPAALANAFVVASREGWKPKAVVVVNLYGQSADMDPIIDICNQYNVPILEDAAESLGAHYKNKHSGTFGKLGAFSFNGNKIITTSGGGMLVSDDEELINKARFLSTQARDPAPHYEHSEIGYNYRMSNILAGVGRGQLQVLEERVKARRSVFDTYVKELSDISAIEWMPQPEWSYANRWLTTATISPNAKIGSKELIKKLSEDFIEARPVWKPMHLQPVFAGTRYFTAENGSIADDLFENGICFPSGSNMTTQQLERIISAIRKILK
jgi:dTDP-4-amino-4,6-dideoxygalactose transaminase